MRRRVHSSSWLIFIMVCLVATAFSQSVPPVSFRAAPTYAANPGPSPSSFSVAVGDFNGDGKPDLAALNVSGIIVLLGNGDGTFQARVGYVAGSDPISVAVGDFNGDGKPDLAVANVHYNVSFFDRGTNNVNVLLGNGDGTFQAAANYAAGSGPQSVAVGDFNGDG